jgi:23S rRNA (cytosine1962-C5)-methyltransferase
MVSRTLSLIDCGGGRRLDRLGELLLDRPAPSAEAMTVADPGAWAGTDARFDRVPGEPGAWSGTRIPTAPWRVEAEGLQFELRATATGQVGIFLEQLPMWGWLREQCRGRELEVLNLFAHTGGSTLAAAAEGASVVHVDGSKSAVSWARRNAEINGLATARVRWIVEDVGLFVQRELKRGHGYDAVILDPPSYGHGPHRELWQLEAQLPPLLQNVAALTRGRCAFVLLTAHTPGFEGGRLGRDLSEGLQLDGVESGSLDITADSGNRLPAGSFARVVST